MVAEAIELCGSLVILEQLQTHSNPNVSKLATQMLSEYFHNKETSMPVDD